MRARVAVVVSVGSHLAGENVIPYDVDTAIRADDVLLELRRAPSDVREAVEVLRAEARDAAANAAHRLVNDRPVASPKRPGDTWIRRDDGFGNTKSKLMDLRQLIRLRAVAGHRCRTIHDQGWRDF